MDETAQRPGRVHLIGGGRDEREVTGLFAAFVDDAARIRGAGRPTVCALLVVEEDDTETAERFGRLLAGAGADADIHVVIEGDAFSAGVAAEADGIFVGGGLTPAYHAAVAEAAPLIRQRVLDGAPYLGFSAGAAIAADRALIGGCRIDGVVVCDPDAGEELDEVAVADGLGLVPFTVDVHAAQWGTLARLTAAVAAGLVGPGVAIDEHTAVTVRAGDPLGEARATGTGAMWHAVAVAGEPPTVAITRIAGTADTA